MPNIRLKQNTLGSDIILDREDSSSFINIWAFQGLSTLVDIILRQTVGIISFPVEGPPSTYFGILKRWTGAVWVKSKLKVWNSSQWVNGKLKFWSGTEWKLIDTTGI